jgi:hypothetical protein
MTTFVLAIVFIPLLYWGGLKLKRKIDRNTK